MHGNGHLQVVGADFGEPACRQAGRRSWRTTEPRPAICTLLGIVF